MDLKVVTGTDRDRVFKLYEGQSLVVGRSSSSDTQLQDPHVSRKHCVLQCVATIVTVTDCGSSGGSFINGRRISSSETIRPGDILRIGRTEIRYELSDSSVDESTVTALPNSMLPDHHQNRTMILGNELSELVGQEIEGYEVEKEIATGRTGVVFLVKQSESGKRFAMKVLWPALSEDDAAMKRFMVTMNTMRDVKHPNIVRLYGAGKSDDYCWLLMEYVKGMDAAKLIERAGDSGMLEWQIAFRIAVHISRALEAAAASKIVHRNIAPQNIIVQASDKVAKLGGLMLVKALNDASSKDLSAVGEMIGKLPYMSPEAVSGSNDLDTRSDIYSLGATVYSLLSGQPPFESKSMLDIIDQIRVQVPARPDRRGMATNDRFEAIVMKMLAKRPEDRYQTPKLLLKDLNFIVQSQGFVI